jgi:hypothetical protein
LPRAQAQARADDCHAAAGDPVVTAAGWSFIALGAGRVVINPLIYAEVSVGYRSAEELDDLLPASDYEREPLPYRVGFAAGKAYLRYRQSGGGKRSPMPDFYIGAHAAVAGYQLLTRDASRYRNLFPEARADRARRLSQTAW